MFQDATEVFYSPEKDLFSTSAVDAAKGMTPGSRIIRFKRAGDAEVVQTVMFGLKRGRKAKGIENLDEV